VPYRVLVADDEEFERRALRLILGAEGMPELEVIEASNGLEAVELVGDDRLDAAFLDIRMPGLDGIDAASALRKSRPRLPIIFLTAHDSFEYARSALRLRVEDFLLKPASPEEVAAALRRALSSGGADADARIEGAAALLADELRSALGSGAVPEELLSRYLDLSGRNGGAAAVVSLRCEACGSRGGPALRQAARLFERLCACEGRVAIAGAGPAEALGVVAGAQAADPEEGLRASLEALVARSKDDLGISIAAGAALPSGQAPASAAVGGLLIQAARRAAALAGGGRPIIVLAIAPVAGLSPQDGAEADGARDGSGRRIANRALELLESRHAEDLSLESVASDLGVSPSHLSRVLGRHAGMGFADCLARLRVGRAKTYLASPSVSVKEAASMVGFRDPAYFARVFRRFEGESPAEYKSRAFGPEGGSK